MPAAHDPATSPPSEPPHSGGRIAIALLVLVALLQVAAFAWYVPGNDWARDLGMASAIVDGGDLPLRGPRINGGVHLGPVWFWLLSLPLALGAGYTGMALSVGALATLKVPLAWRLGADLDGRRLALAFAVLMLLPGWNLLHSLQLTHTVLLETLLLASWLPLLGLWRDGAGWRWALFGLLAGLAVHAHPVALVLVLPAAVVAWRRRGRRDDIAWIAVGLLLAALPLLPMLLAEWRDGWPALQAARRMAAAPTPDDATTPLDLAAALGPGHWSVLHAWLPARFADATGACLAIVVALAIAGIPALVRDPAKRRLALAGAGLLLLALLWLPALRYRTPFYMLVLALPALAWLLALPLAALAGHGRGGRIAATCALAAALAASTIATVGLMRHMQSGHGVFPLPAIGDVRRLDTAATHIALMPIHEFDRLAAQRCGDAPLHVHGELAVLVDFYQGIPFRWHCPGMTVVLMGDAGDGRHWAGTTPHTLRLLGHGDTGWAAARALSPRRVIAPQAPAALATGNRYPHRPVLPEPAAAQTVVFVAGADEAVSAYSPMWAFAAASAPQARCDGVVVPPASTTDAGALFLPPHAGAGCAWEIRVDSRVPDHVDIVTLPLVR